MKMRIGESRIIPGEYRVDGKAFRTYDVGDRVTLTDQNGNSVPFDVSDVTEDDKLVLLRSKDDGSPIPLGPFGTSSVVISADFKDAKTGFSTKTKELVTVTDSRGRSTKLQVDVVVGREFVVLGLPGNSAMSFLHKLKLLWHIGKS